jgi:methionyl-tRNA synthetase
MLQAAGLPLPEQVFAHGFVQLSGERFSKSAGVRLELSEAVERFGPDALRYFLLREVPFDGDGNFSWERFEERYVADLANALGNLASRTIAMVERYCGGVVPDVSAADFEAAASWVRAEQDRYVAAMDHHLLHEGLAAAWRIVARANEYVDRQAPWKLAKDPACRSELDRTLATLTWTLAWLAALVGPFMPGKAQALWEQLGAAGAVQDFRWPTDPAQVGQALNPSGWRARKGAPLFPKDQAEQREPVSSSGQKQM